MFRLNNILRLGMVLFVVVISWVLDLDVASAAGMVVMGDISTSDIRQREDLSGVIDVLKLRDDDMKYLSFVNFLPSIAKAFGKKVTAQKHEWLDDAARAENINAGAADTAEGFDGAADTTGCKIKAGDTEKLRVGDMLLLGDLLEVVVVKSINVGADTIDVYARGHGSTTGAAQGEDQFDIAIIGNAQIENGDPLDADHTSQTEAFNYTQIFEDVAQISGTVRRSRGAIGDELDRQIVKKLREMLKSLNRTLVEGIKNLDTTNKIGTMGGLREYITNTSNVAGALTKANLYTAVISHMEAGLFPSAIHGSPTTIGDIELLYESSVRSKTGDKKGGTDINVLVIMGYEIELHVDKHVRSTEALILDYNRIGYGELDGGVKGMSGKFATYPILDKTNGKQISKQVLGEYTMRVSNGGGTRMYGIA